MGGVGSGGDGTDFRDASVGGDGGSGFNGGNGGSGGSAGDGGTGGTEAGQGGAAGTGGGNGGSGGSPDPGELMTDPSFESGLGGWVLFGSSLLTRVQTEFRTGTSSLLSSSRDNYWNGPGVEIASRVAAAPDAQYIFSAYIRSAGGEADAGAPASTRELALTLKTRCPGQTDEGSNFDTLGTAPLTDDWTLLTGATIIPRHCPAPLDYRIYIAEPYETPGPWPDFYLDDVSLKLAEQ